MLIFVVESQAKFYCFGCIQVVYISRFSVKNLKEVMMLIFVVEKSAKIFCSGCIQVVYISRFSVKNLKEVIN